MENKNLSKPEMVLLIRFRSRLPLDEVTKVLEERAPEFRALAGLQQKYYLQDTSTGEIAGLYLWRSQNDLTAYQNSKLRTSIAEAYQVEGAPRIEVYRVLQALIDELA